MKTILLFILLLLLELTFSLSSISFSQKNEAYRSSSLYKDDAIVLSGVQDVIDRVMMRGLTSIGMTYVKGSFKPLLEFIESNENDCDVYEIDGDSVTNKIIFRGSSGIALTKAFGDYLKYYLNCDVHWENAGDYSFQSFPSSIESMPIPASLNRVVAMSKIRYYQNTCTASYSFVWRDWTSYEQEIDWMAINGINAPLVMMGQEMVWTELYKSYGVSQEGLDDFFTGPAFLTWQRMSNIRKYGGPLPSSWVKQQAELQKKILLRYGELGMQPVLPSFNGVVPAEMQKLYPNANITRLSVPWNNFPDDYCCNYIVASTDPLFVEIGTKFLSLQDEIYSTFKLTHFYNADTFNENVPQSNTQKYLSSSSSAVYESIKGADYSGIWVMQAWMFINDNVFWTDEAISYYLSGVPDDGLLVLDLMSEEQPVWDKINKNGKSFVWCMLHNFGGSRAIYGNLTLIASTPIEVLTEAPNTFSGIGLTMEAIDQNPIVYELMIEMGFNVKPVEVSQWVESYVTRRYGLKHPSVTASSVSDSLKAWKILSTFYYSGTEGCYHPTCLRRSMITTRPLLNLVQEKTLPATQMVEAWFLLNNVNLPFHSNAFAYDLIDVGRQVMSNLFNDLYHLWIAAYERKSVKSFDNLSTSLLQLISDWDVLLSSHEGYLVGKWISDALEWATNDEEKRVYEFNARNQITHWGPKAINSPHVWGSVNDYAAKNWGGLAKGYYYKRWELLTAMVMKSMNEGEAFNLTSYEDIEMELGSIFSFETNVYPSHPVYDPLVSSLKMQKLYGNEYDSSYTEYFNHDISSINNINVNATWTLSIGQLKFLCDADPQCLGFSSNGFLKQSVSTIFSNVGINLYVKN